MQHLWSPWRMDSLRTNNPDAGPGCIFCDLPAQAADEANLIVYRGALAFVILNRFPYNNGHLMVVPFEHVPSFEQLEAAALAEIMALTNQALAALRRMYQPQAFNVGANIGAAAGAGIADHVHMHVVPRWVGDTNFMATVADTRAIPHHLADTSR